MKNKVIVIGKLFSNIDVNKGGQIEWDYAKVFTIFAMICSFSGVLYI